MKYLETWALLQIIGMIFGLIIGFITFIIYIILYIKDKKKGNK